MAAPGALRGVNPGLRPAVGHPGAHVRVKPSQSDSQLMEANHGRTPGTQYNNCQWLCLST